MAADEGERGGLRNIWQAIGSLEANVARLLDGQANLRSDLRDTRSDLRDTRSDLRDGLKTTNARIDKLLWLGLGLAGGVVTLLVLEVIQAAT